MKFHLLIFVGILLTAFINYVNCQLELDELTDDEYEQALEELLAYVDEQFETNGKLNAQSTSWNPPDAEQLDKNCQNFHWDRNLTRSLVKVYSCKRQFFNGKDKEWNQMEARELISTYCDDKNWAGYVGCVMPNLQNYIETLLQCMLGSEWSSPSSQAAGNSLLDTVEYTLELIPRILKSAWTMQCSNKEFLANLFEANKEFHVINPVLLNVLNKQQHGSQMEKSRINYKLASCMANKNPEVLPHIDSTCMFIAYVDWKSATECLFVLDELNSPEVHNAVKKIYPLLEFLQDENQGGQTKHEFLNLLRYEFCSVDSPLGAIFNYDEQNEKEKILEELREVNAQLVLAKRKLRALNENAKMASQIRYVQGVLGIVKEKANRNVTNLTHEEL